MNPPSYCLCSSSCVHCPYHVTPSSCLQIRLVNASTRQLLPLVSHATTLRSRLARPSLLPPRSPILAPARIPSPSTLRIRRWPPQIAIRSTPSPLQPSRLARRTPEPTAQAQASPPSHRPTSKRKTLLRYVARVARSPCPSPLEVWISSHFRRNAAGYGVAQDIYFTIEPVASFLIPQHRRIAAALETAIP